MRDALSLLDQAIALGSGKVAENDVRQMIGAVDKQYLYELLTGIVNQDGEALLAKRRKWRRVPSALTTPWANWPYCCNNSP
ncbi:DNA polymerase III subunits gamma and tau [Neisseria gonorrhoeae]|nr:DNA polymerase III subunits gamma and tau [Neisseria gonorrhoeae]